MWVYGIIAVQLAINWAWCLIVCKTNLKVNYQTSSFFYVLASIAILIAMNFCIYKCKDFANRKPYNIGLLIFFTLLECHIAAWFAAMFFEGPLVTLLLGCASICSILIIGVSWYYSKYDKTGDDKSALEKLEGGIENLAGKIQNAVNKEEEPKAGNNKRMFLYVLCGLVCLTTIILTCCFDIKTKWWHGLLVCLGMTLWIYIFVENVMIIMDGDRDDLLDSYIVGARTIYGNFLGSFWHLIQWFYEWCSKTCCKPKEKKELAAEADAEIPAADTTEKKTA